MSESDDQFPSGQPNNPDPYGGAPQSNPYGTTPPPPPSYSQQPPANPYGAPQYHPTSVPGYAGGPGYGMPGAPAPTDGVSIAALVASLLGLCTGIGFLVGLVLGIIGLSRTKNGQRRGRGMAISGLVIGAVGIVLTIAIVVVAVVVGLNTIVTPSNAQVGQCVNITEDGNKVSMVKKSCTGAHDAEIVGVATVTADNLADASSNTFCGEIISPAHKTALSSRHDLTLTSVTENPDHVKVGDHVACYVEGPGKLYADVLGD